MLKAREQLCLLYREKEKIDEKCRGDDAVRLALFINAASSVLLVTYCLKVNACIKFSLLGLAVVRSTRLIPETEMPNTFDCLRLSVFA